MTEATKSPKKKKLVRIAGLEGRKPTGYTLSNLNFSLVSSPENGRRQLVGLNTCREGFCSAIMNAVGQGKEIDRDRFRMLLVKDVSEDAFKTFRTKLFSGKAAMNLIEEQAGWSSSSIITTVKHEFYKTAWLLTGPKEWMSQPQFISLAGLVMRIAMKFGPLETDSFDALMENFKKIRKADPESTYGDNYHTGLLYERLELLLANHNKIFKGIDFKKAWSKEDEDGSFGVESGITTFCSPKCDIMYSQHARSAKEMFQKMLTKKGIK